MRINPNFNPEMNEISIGLEVRFLDKYYTCLKDMVKKGENKLPKSLKLRKTGKNEVEFIFSLPKTHESRRINENLMSVAIDDSDGTIKSLHELINKFINSGVKNEFKTHEFIPLKNYPVENIVKDLKESAKNKRNLVIIADYEEYLASQEEKDVTKIRYTQYIVNYGTSEWADILLMAHSGSVDMNEMRKIYTPKLQSETWI